MRVHFIFALAVGLGACGSNSQNIDASASGVSLRNKEKSFGVSDAPFNFSSPIYIVPDENFWSGCPDQSTTAGESCRASRVSVVEDGVKQWTDYFPVADKPIVWVVEKENLPENTNGLQIIDFFVDNSRCTGVSLDPCSVLWACYEPQPKDIVFMDDEYVTAQVVAHELGHAFGLPHTEWLNAGCAAPIMTKPVQSKFVTDLDVQFLCRKHPEIACPINKGTFYKTMLDTISCDRFWELEKENTCKQ